jgi:hypothetical protein
MFLIDLAIVCLIILIFIFFLFISGRKELYCLFAYFILMIVRPIYSLVQRKSAVKFDVKRLYIIKWEIYNITIILSFLIICWLVIKLSNIEIFTILFRCKIHKFLHDHSFSKWIDSIVLLMPVLQVRWWIKAKDRLNGWKRFLNRRLIGYQ